MCPFVEHPPLGCQPVLFPNLLDVDEPPLPLAEHQVLEAREGEDVVFGVHGSLKAQLPSGIRLPMEPFRVR